MLYVLCNTASNLLKNWHRWHVFLFFVLFCFFSSILVFFHNHSWITGLQRKGEGISLTPHYHFHQVHRHLDISQAITAERQQPDSNQEPLVSKCKLLTTKLCVLTNTLIWCHRHTNKNIQGAHGPIDWNAHINIYKYILTAPVMCTQQVPVLHWMNNLIIIHLNNLRSTMQVFAFQKLLTCRSHISAD